MGEPQPMAEGAAAPPSVPAASKDAPPPMAEPAVAELPATSSPGLVDDSSSIMRVCHSARSKLVASVGPDFINQVTDEGAE
eukprot:4167094-Alexandrium_andersonii.AAC.1